MRWPRCARRSISCATTRPRRGPWCRRASCRARPARAISIALHGRGVFVAISPWNFPLAIFTGQIAAALAVGNAVLAKPAPQTPLIAARAVALLHAGGRARGRPDPAARAGRRSARAWSRARRSPASPSPARPQTAWRINRALAAKDGPIPALIAETGGQNAMLVDSSALPEQVVADVLLSAFRSAGQRCSALRVLYVQDAIAPTGARDAGRRDARAARRRSGPARDRHRPGDRRGRARAPDRTCRADAARGAADPARAARSGARPRLLLRAARLRDRTIEQLEGEVFGPILHVVRFAGDRLDQVVDAINGTGYGLTLGVHSRIDQTIERVLERARAGNIYVNRNMIGAVVGVQPFGGERPVGHRPQGRRPALSAALRDRAHGQHQHRRGRRQRRPAQPRRRAGAGAGGRLAGRRVAEAERIGRIDAQPLDVVREESQLLERVPDAAPAPDGRPPRRRTAPG